MQRSCNQAVCGTEAEDWTWWNLYLTNSHFKWERINTDAHNPKATQWWRSGGCRPTAPPPYLASFRCQWKMQPIALLCGLLHACKECTHANYNTCHQEGGGRRTLWQPRNRSWLWGSTHGEEAQNGGLISLFVPCHKQHGVPCSTCMQCHNIRGGKNKKQMNANGNKTEGATTRQVGDKSGPKVSKVRRAIPLNKGHFTHEIGSWSMSVHVSKIQQISLPTSAPSAASSMALRWWWWVFQESCRRRNEQLKFQLCS